MTSTAKGLVALLCGAAAAGLLSACKAGADQASAQDAPPPLAALPLTNVSAPQSKPGPLAVDLPYARPARIGPALDPGDGYAYLDRAYFLNDAFGEAPPDYAFDYDDETPWAWRTDDGFVRVVEVLPYGDRYYYFQPGDDDPFLIRDPDYAYAFAAGDLVAIYDQDGALLPPEDLMLHAPIAGRELARSRGMLRGAENRQPVPIAAWTSRRGQFASELSQWQKLESHQTAWRRYHEAHLKTEQAHWAPERFRREAEAARVLQGVHDPDGAQHAWRAARQAQDVARKAHVQIALLQHSPAGASGRGEPRQAPPPMRGPGSVRGPESTLRARGDTRLAMEAYPVPGRGPRFDRGARADFAMPRRGRDEQLAMASRGPEPRAEFNVRRHERTFETPAEPRLRAAEQARLFHQERPQPAAHEFEARGGRDGGGEHAPRLAQAREASQPQHLQIVVTPHPQPEHGGGNGGNGGHGGGQGGGHGGSPDNHGRGH